MVSFYDDRYHPQIALFLYYKDNIPKLEAISPQSENIDKLVKQVQIFLSWVGLDGLIMKLPTFNGTQADFSIENGLKYFVEFGNSKYDIKANESLDIDLIKNWNYQIELINIDFLRSALQNKIGLGHPSIYQITYGTSIIHIAFTKLKHDFAKEFNLPYFVNRDLLTDDEKTIQDILL